MKFKAMAKYNPTVIKKFIDSIEAKTGRVRACKNVGISYQTFLDWTNPEHPNFKLEFIELLKKAEAVVNIEQRDYAISAIFSKMKDHWQAAAWWLERNYPDQFRNKSEVDSNIKSSLSKETIETIADLSRRFLKESGDGKNT